MARAHHAHHAHHVRRQFDWNDIPGSIASAIEAPFDPRDQNTAQNGPKTVTQVIYSTMAATFPGPTASLVTVSQQASDPATTKSDSKTKVTVSLKSTKTADTSTFTSTSSSASITKQSSTDGATGSVDAANQTTSAASATSTSTLAQDSTTGTVMGTGAKAGIAIGVILVVGAVAILVFLLFNHRKRTAQREHLDDEKNTANWDSGAFGGPPAIGANRAASTRTARTASTAPRLSLRPVTEFLPNLGDKRTSRGNVLQMASGPTPTNASRAIAPQGQNSVGRPMYAHSPPSENPFGNHAETVDPINAAGPTPVEDVTASGDFMSGSGAAAGTAVTGASLALKRGASKGGNTPKPLDFTTNNTNFYGPGAASPTGTEYSISEASGAPVQTNSGAAIAAAGGPQNSSVHRVQLDFKPSMEDELELRAGQLIRLLHEYDDGWALCIRLDRSQQGVVPRTCLSTRPVKPRPNPGSGPGPNGHPRGAPPLGMRVPGYAQPGPPMSGPNMGNRSQSPGGPQNQSRPMTATGRQSPSGQQRQDRRITPPGPSRMNPSPPSTSPQQSLRNSPQNSISQPAVGRKPVPGQAM